jgi:hypothetical protein
MGSCFRQWKPTEYYEYLSIGRGTGPIAGSGLSRNVRESIWHKLPVPTMTRDGRVLNWVSWLRTGENRRSKVRMRTEDFAEHSRRLSWPLVSGDLDVWLPADGISNTRFPSARCPDSLKRNAKADRATHDWVTILSNRSSKSEVPRPPRPASASPGIVCRKYSQLARYVMPVTLGPP